MNRLIATILAVALVVVSLAGSAGATHLDPNAIRPWVASSEKPIGDDGGWVVPPIRDGGQGTSRTPSTLLGWTIKLGEYYIINFFLDNREVGNGTNTNEPTDAHRPVNQR